MCLDLDKNPYGSPDGDLHCPPPPDAAAASEAMIAHLVKASQWARMIAWTAILTVIAATFIAVMTFTGIGHWQSTLTFLSAVVTAVICARAYSAMKHYRQKVRQLAQKGGTFADVGDCFGHSNTFFQLIVMINICYLLLKAIGLLGIVLRTH